MSVDKRRWYRMKIDNMLAIAALITRQRKINTNHIKWLLIQEASRL